MAGRLARPGTHNIPDPFSSPSQDFPQLSRARRKAAARGRPHFSFLLPSKSSRGSQVDRTQASLIHFTQLLPSFSGVRNIATRAGCWSLRDGTSVDHPGLPGLSSTGLRLQVAGWGATRLRPLQPDRLPQPGLQGADWSPWSLLLLQQPHYRRPRIVYLMTEKLQRSQHLCLELG